MSEINSNFPAQSNFKEVISSDEVALSKIDESVNFRMLYGKFVGPVVIHGDEIASNSYNSDKSGGFDVLPEERWKFFQSDFDSANRARAFRAGVIEDIIKKDSGKTLECTPEGLNFLDSLIITYFPNPKDVNFIRLRILVPTSYTDLSVRRSLLCDALCEMPVSKHEEFKELIKKNPDNAERFMQITFKGLDQVAERVSVPNVSLVNIDQYIPVNIVSDKVRNGLNLPYFMFEAVRKKQVDTSAVETYHFSQQYPQLLNTSK